MGATNHPWNIEEAMLRRFEKRVLVPLPDDDAKVKLFKLYLGEKKISDDVRFDDLVEMTDVYPSKEYRNIAVMISGRYVRMSVQDCSQKLITVIYRHWTTEGGRNI